MPLFYIGQEGCSGIKTDNETEFYEYINDAVLRATDNGDNIVEVTIRTSHDPSIEENDVMIETSYETSPEGCDLIIEWTPDSIENAKKLYHIIKSVQMSIMCKRWNEGRSHEEMSEEDRRTLSQAVMDFTEQEYVKMIDEFMRNR